MNIPEKTKYKILLVDDHDLVRAGIRMLISDIDMESEIVEAHSGEESIDIVDAGGIDIVFMDIILPGIDGVTAALRLLHKRPDLKVIMLTGCSDKSIPKALLQAGISGYMTKSSAIAEIKYSIDAAVRGLFYLSKDLSTDFKNELVVGENPFDRLSERELQVVSLLMNGFRTSDAGNTLVLNAKTVSTYKRRAFEKLQVENTPQLIKLAITCGVLGAG